MELTDLKLQLEKTTQVCIKQEGTYITSHVDSKPESPQAMGCSLLGISFGFYPEMEMEKSISVFLKRKECRIMVFSCKQNV